MHYFIKNLEEAKIKLKVDHPKLYIFICGEMSYEIIEKNLVLKTSNAKTIHLLGVKDERFIMDSLYMTTKYISPLVLFFDQGHKVPNIDSKSLIK